MTDPRPPVWGHPLFILAAPYLAAFAGWLFATALNAIVWGGW